MTTKILQVFNKAAGGIIPLVALLLCVSCAQNTQAELDAVVDQSDTPSLELYNYETFITDSGTVKYHIKTPEMVNYDRKEEPYTEYPKGGEITVYSGKDTVSSYIKCSYAKNFSKDELWDLRNNVKAINEDGVEFETEQLFWDAKEEKIYTEEFIKITTGDEVITGYGLTANQNMKEYQITKVAGVIGVDE